MAEKLEVDPKTVERWVTQDRIPYPRHRHAIAALVKESERYLWPTALTSEKAAEVSQSELVQLYPRRVNVPDELWRRLLRQAAEQIDVLVYAGLFLIEQDLRWIGMLKEKAEAGVQVRVLLGDPGAEEIAQRSIDESTVGVMEAKIRQVDRYYAKIQNVPGVDIRRHRTILYNSIYRFDDEMLVNTHIFGLPAPHAPVLHLHRLAGGGFFDQYAESFSHVLAQSERAGLT